MKTIIFQSSEHSLALKPFYTFDLNNFKLFDLIFKKAASTSALKNLQKSENFRSQIAIFDFEVASKLFSKIFPMTNFEFQ